MPWSHTLAFSGTYTNPLMAPTYITSCTPWSIYCPGHWVVPVDFPNTRPLKIVTIFYRINARSGHDFNTLTRLFPNQQWYNKPTHDLVERLLFPLSFYRRYIKFRERYEKISDDLYLSSIYAILVDIFWCV